VSKTTSTIYEVARRAGVSIATVSRVQGGHHAVSLPTRERVRQAIDELGYRPSRSARALAGLRHDATGIVFPDLSGPYYSEVILGYEERASDAGQSVFILGTHGRPRATEQVTELADRVDGLVVMGRTVVDDVVEELHDAGVPIVLLARPPAAGADTVRSENEEAAQALTRHLLEHGHSAFAFLGNPDASPDVAERWAGFSSALRTAGAEAPPAAVPAGFREADGHRAATMLLDAGQRPDAIVAANDEVAIGAYRAARERGLGVPTDIAITGWDDIALSEHVGPGITTVRQPLRQLGATAARLLFERIRGDRTEPHHVLLPTALVIRASCGSHAHQEETTWSNTNE
jgi:LacI family transcriptional regulator